MVKPTRWWWIRHAPVIGMEGVLYGDSDVACDTTNQKAFENLAKILPVDAFWMTSHLSRTHQTADAIRNAGLNFSNPIIEANLGEQNFGDWQGLSWDEMEKLDPKGYGDFWQSPARNRPPSGESFQDQITRVSVVIDRLNCDRTCKKIVAVAHSGSIRAAISHALKVSPETGMSFSISNLSVTCLEYVTGGLLKEKGEAWRVICINRETCGD